MTPLTKLVEAFQEFQKAARAERDYFRENCEGRDICRQAKEITDERYRLYRIESECRDKVLAIVEEIASAPQKEFPPGYTRNSWVTMAAHFESKGMLNSEAACRQIADSLE